jgi:hypothetical protein
MASKSLKRFRGRLILELFVWFFVLVVERGFCRGFWGFRGANVVSLHGGCGGLLVSSWLFAASKSGWKNVTRFWDLFST